MQRTCYLGQGIKERSHNVRSHVAQRENRCGVRAHAIWVRVLKNDRTMYDRTSLKEKTGVECVRALLGLCIKERSHNVQSHVAHRENRCGACAHAIWVRVLKNDRTMCDRTVLKEKTDVECMLVLLGVLKNTRTPLTEKPGVECTHAIWVRV